MLKVSWSIYRRIWLCFAVLGVIGELCFTFDMINRTHFHASMIQWAIAIMFLEKEFG